MKCESVLWGNNLQYNFSIGLSFGSGTYNQIVTQSEMTLYRVYGNKSAELGSFWTITEPVGGIQSIIDLALDPAWGNNASEIATIRVPAGTTIYTGYAAPQGGLVGGGSQVYIPEVDPAWIVK